MKSVLKKLISNNNEKKKLFYFTTRFTMLCWFIEQYVFRVNITMIISDRKVYTKLYRFILGIHPQTFRLSFFCIPIDSKYLLFINHTRLPYHLVVVYELARGNIGMWYTFLRRIKIKTIYCFKNIIAGVYLMLRSS